MRMYDSVRVKFQRLQAKSRSSALCTDLGTRPCDGGGGGGSIGGDDDGRLAGPPFPTLLADGNDLAAIVHAIHNGILKNGVLTHGGAGLLVQSTPGGGKSTLLKALARHYRGHVCAQLSGRDLSGQSRCIPDMKGTTGMSNSHPYFVLHVPAVVTLLQNFLQRSLGKCIRTVASSSSMTSTTSSAIL